MESRTQYLIRTQYLLTCNSWPRRRYLTSVSPPIVCTQALICLAFCPQVEMVYTKFASLISSDPIVQTMLPLTPAGEICDVDGNCVDPDEDELFKLTTKDGTLTLEREKVHVSKGFLAQSCPVCLKRELSPCCSLKLTAYDSSLTLERKRTVRTPFCLSCSLFPSCGTPAAAAYVRRPDRPTPILQALPLNTWPRLQLTPCLQG